MRVILEQVEGEFYCDIILKPKEIDKITLGKMIEGFAFLNRQRYHVGVLVEEATADDDDDELWLDDY